MHLIRSLCKRLPLRARLLPRQVHLPVQDCWHSGGPEANRFSAFVFCRKLEFSFLNCFLWGIKTQKMANYICFQENNGSENSGDVWGLHCDTINWGIMEAKYSWHGHKTMLWMCCAEAPFWTCQVETIKSEPTRTFPKMGSPDATNVKKVS